METKAEILQLLQSHIKRYPSRPEALKQFINFVQQHKAEQLFDRKNFTGHITASAFIINEKSQELLLLKHKFLNRWLQPGGHVDQSDISLMASALREAEEETGIAAADLISVGNTVFDFESHLIPENVRKQELPHYHHDVRFLFTSSKTKLVSLAKEESTDSRWFPFSELTHDVDFDKVVKKIKLFKSEFREREVDR